MEQIKKFTLPTVTNSLYTNEAISSIYLTKEIANKINELIDSYNNLGQIRYDIINELEGKINKGVIFMKDNLANSLYDLFEVMKSNGDIDNIISESILSKITMVENEVFPYGNILRYNPFRDGQNDDTLALLNASENAKKYGTPFIVPTGKYKISEDIDLRGIKDVIIDGEIATTNNSTIIVGDISSNGNGVKVNIKRAKNVKVMGAKNSIFYIDYCEKLHLFANGDDKNSASIAYCQFYGAYCKEILIDSIGSSDNIGWINENVFRIKRVEKITMDGNYPHNNNHFEHINFEKGELNLLNARNNYFSARCEGGVNINNGTETNHNFVEKEYYYKHYFGDSVVENEKGVISYFPVNKLQVEKELLLIDKNNKNFPVGSLTFNENGTFNGVTYNSVFHSDLIEIDKTFALKIKSDSKAFRVQLNFYDENKNPILSEVDNFSDGRMNYNGESANWLYSVTANVNEDSVNFYSGRAKYVEYNVIFGNNVESININYLIIKLVKLVNTDIHISNRLKNNVYTQVPTQGYWEQGHILYGKNPLSGASVGIVCTQSGNPGVWKNFGSIAS